MTDTISDVSSLEQHFDEPLELAVAVMLDSLDKYQRQFISLSPFVCIATSDADNQPTISPKGDAPGFVQVIDEHTLVIPDRIGNNKVESFHNLVENPKMALIFMIPGIRETLRISGEAQITTDQELLKPCQVGANPVKTGLLIKVTKCYFHCGKAMIRSKLWQDDHKLTAKDFPSFGVILKEEAAMQESTKEIDDVIEDAYTNNLY